MKLKSGERNNTGGGLQSTVTSASWSILETMNQMMSLKGKATDGTVCPVIIAVTVTITPVKMEEVLLVVNKTTFLNDDNELESFNVTWG